jgi:aspartyl-tRNA(Asn)/glutamyl-tRNA(Gln) amidotransferase subunit A
MYNNSLTELSRMIKNKEIKPSELCAAFLSRYSEIEPKVNAFITLDREAVMQRAKELDEIPVTPETPVLFGIPVAVKDNICTKDMRTTCASKMLGDFIPLYDAAVITKLKEAGAVIMGKTDMDEFAMGSTCETSYFVRENKKGRVANPYNYDHVPGGTSGGSAAAVASGSAAAALGSDTGGSVRLPAAYCGLVGYKPTYGAVSRHGLIAYAGSFDQIGPITKTVGDAALLTSVIADDFIDFGNIKDIKDIDMKGKRIGVIKECTGDGVLDVPQVYNALEVYKSLGAEITEISMPSVKESLSVYYILAMAEASSNLAKYDGVRFGWRAENPGDANNANDANSGLEGLYINSRAEAFGDEVRRRILLGTYILSTGRYELYYKKAKAAQAVLCGEFKRAFEQDGFDVLFTPVARGAAPKFGGGNIEMFDKCTVPANIAGLPAVSAPCGFSDGLPVGFQLIGNRFDDANLLGFARAFEMTEVYKS